MKKRLFFILLWAYGLSLIVFFTTRTIVGDEFLPVRLTNYFLPWVVSVLPPAFVAAAYLRKKAISIVLLVDLLLAALSFSYLFANCGKQATAHEGSRTIKIMSYNICRYNHSYAAVAKVIAEESTDLVLMQEVQPFQSLLVRQQLARQSGHDDWHLAYDPKVDQAIISRFPILQMEVSARNNRKQKVLLQTPFGEILVINIHGYRDGWKKRHLGIEKIIVEDVLSDRYPVVFGGDFNTTDQSETFQAVRRHLRNSHLEAGCGFGFTFPANETALGHELAIPRFLRTALVRIDHIFFSRHFRAVHAYTVAESGGSDHYPVVVELEMPSMQNRS